MLSSLEMWHGSSASHSKAILPLAAFEAEAFIASMKGFTSVKHAKPGSDPVQFLLNRQRSVRRRFARARQQVVAHGPHDEVARRKVLTATPETQVGCHLVGAAEGACRCGCMSPAEFSGSMHRGSRRPPGHSRSRNRRVLAGPCSCRPCNSHRGRSSISGGGGGRKGPRRRRPGRQRAAPWLPSRLRDQAAGP